MTHSATWLIPDDHPIDWRSKCFGPKQEQHSIADLVAARTRLTELPTPLMTLDAAAVEHNIGAMNTFLDTHQVKLAPHGKTTMSPQLWKRQIEAGAWAITVATPWQLRVAAAHGIRRIMHAGAVLSPADLCAIATLLDADSEMAISVWADSPSAAEQIAAGYPTAARPLDVLVDRGGPGARTGARTDTAALATADAIANAPQLRLAGIAAWEGSLIGASGTQGRRLVAQFCDEVAATFRIVVDAGLLSPTAEPIVTAGGSTYFDIVVERWASLSAMGAQIILRSGCYLTHDDGLYATGSPFGNTISESLSPALHLWGQVVSRPEPGLALLNFGRRDAPHDAGLPIPQRIRGREGASSAAALAGAEISALNDQHAYLLLSHESDLAVGEVVQCGVSHPCTAFDKWSMIPVIDDAHSAEPVVVGAVRTVF